MKKQLLGFVLVAALPTLVACGGVEKLKQAGENIADQCDLKCKGVLETNGSVTGSVKGDAFFVATAKVNAQATAISAEIESSLDELGATIEVDVKGKAGAEAKAGAIVDALKGGLNGKLEGGVKVVYQKPKCEVSAHASVQAAAKCDVEVDPGRAEVVCKGSCEVKAEVNATCDASVKVRKGTAPSFACTGTCHGSCELKTAAKCEGTCHGTCELTAEGKCDGECSVALDKDGKCAGECKVGASGSCSTKCTGSCDIQAEAKCDGECRGECTWEKGKVDCTGGDVKLVCEAEANAEVKCQGTCKGEFEPPMVKAECQASAKAEASFDAQCTPPSLRVDYGIKASLDADAKLKLQAQLESFGKVFAKLTAKGAKVELLTSATGELVASGKGAVSASLNASAKSKTVLEAKGAACGVAALAEAGDVLGKAASKLSGSVKAVGAISAQVGGNS
jgi:hypothetical protein